MRRRTSLSHELWQCRQPLRGGVPVQCGAVGIDIIIERVFKAITTARHGLSVRSLEIPAIQVVFGNRKTTLMYQPMMARAQQHQVIETGFTACRPMFDVMGIHEAPVVAARRKR